MSWTHRAAHSGIGRPGQLPCKHPRFRHGILCTFDGSSVSWSQDFLYVRVRLKCSYECNAVYEVELLFANAPSCRCTVKKWYILAAVVPTPVVGIRIGMHGRNNIHIQY